MYELSKTPPFNDAIIIIDVPHRGPKKIWTAWDEADFIKRVNAGAEWSRADTIPEYDLTTFEGCMDYHSHDLSVCWTMRHEEFTLDADDCYDAALYLEWIKPIEEHDNDHCENNG